MRRPLATALITSLLLAGSTGVASAVAPAPKVVDRGPSSVLTGASTHLLGGRDLAYAGGRLYTLDDDTVRVFAPGASGNAAPQRSIQVDVPDGQHGFAIAVGADGTTYVLTSDDDLTSSTVFVFAPGAHGAAPSRSVTNAALGLVSPIDIAERPGGFTLLDNDSNAIFYYAVGASGAPTEAGGIDAGSSTQTRIFGPSTIDTAPDGRLVVRGGDWVSVFARGAQGDVAPLQYLQGSRTRIGAPFGAGLDAAGDLYLATADSWSSTPGHPRVLRFARGASGDTAPVGVLTGGRTGLGLSYLEVLPSGAFAVAAFDPSTQRFDGRVRTFRPLGPYAAPGRPRALRALGKASAARRTLTWAAAVSDADVPLTGYAVRVTCRGKVRLAKVVAPRTRSVALRLGKVRKGRCAATVRARNEVGYGTAATTTFRVRR